MVPVNPVPPRIAVVSGSGLSLEGIFDRVDHEQSFAEIPSLISSGVPGHDGKFVFGELDDVSLVLQCGRIHFYEGHHYAAVTQCVDWLYSIGIANIVFTNAAGGLRAEMQPGDLMAVTTVSLWPFRSWTDRPESIEPDFMVEGCDTSGRYTWVHGPCYETPAEIAALQQLGGDAVGMSTAPEMHRCAELGIRAAAISCITNNCCVPDVLTHDHVLKTAASASDKLTQLLRQTIPSMNRDAV